MDNRQIPDKKPFYYEIFDDFLTEKELNDVITRYNTIDFQEIYTDLFNFLISKELNKDNGFRDFKKKLNHLFNNIFQDKNNRNEQTNRTFSFTDTPNLTDSCFYTFSASYYRENDFLLCHDDMVDERLFAFIFYIEDFDSGKLLIYENDCVSLHKAINVKANRLVIFEVGSLSFHEVQRCSKDGRKAISGWINRKDEKNIQQPVTTEMSIHHNILPFDFKLENEDFYCFEFDQGVNQQKGNISRNDRFISGPFISRRVWDAQSKIIYVPQIEGYELINTEDLIFEKDCYILTNDKINNIFGDILDIFIFECEENVSQFLNYIDGNKNVILEVDALDGHMFVGRRGSCKIYITKVPKTVKLRHFVYLKTDISIS